MPNLVMGSVGLFYLQILETFMRSDSRLGQAQLQSVPVLVRGVWVKLIGTSKVLLSARRRLSDEGAFFNVLQGKRTSSMMDCPKCSLALENCS